MQEPIKKQNIWDLSDEIDNIALAFDKLEDGGEDAVILAAIEEYFGDLLERRDEKLDGYASLIGQCEAHATICKAEADRLASLSKTYANRAVRLKERLKALFEAKEWTKQDTKFHRIWLQADGGKQAMEIAPGVTPGMVPKKYRKYICTFDNEAIRIALEDGKKMPTTGIQVIGGIKTSVKRRPIATLKPRGTGIRIK